MKLDKTEAFEYRTREVCEICGERLDDTDLCLDDMKVCTVCYDEAVENGRV